MERRRASRAAAAAPRAAGSAGGHARPPRAGDPRPPAPPAVPPHHRVGQGGGARAVGAAQQKRVERPGEADHQVEPAALGEVEQGEEVAQGLELALLARQAENLRAQLVELAQPPGPLFLVAQDVAAVEEAQGEGKGGEAGSEEPRQHRREVGPQSEQLAVAVDEAVKLGARGGESSSS